MTDLKHLLYSALLNIFSIFAATAALIALSYTDIQMIVYPLCFVGILGIIGMFSTRILLANCLSKRPLKEALSVMFIALIFGCALNYAVLTSVLAISGVSDMTVMATTAVVGGSSLIFGGILYIRNQAPNRSKQFYFGVILWQSLSGIWAMGFIAYFLWSWSWLA